MILEKVFFDISSLVFVSVGHCIILSSSDLSKQGLLKRLIVFVVAGFCALQLIHLTTLDTLVLTPNHLVWYLNHGLGLLLTCSLMPLCATLWGNTKAWWVCLLLLMLDAWLRFLNVQVFYTPYEALLQIEDSFKWQMVGYGLALTGFFYWLHLIITFKQIHSVLNQFFAIVSKKFFHVKACFFR